jgi:hypothetical protein
VDTISAVHPLRRALGRAHRWDITGIAGFTHVLASAMPNGTALSQYTFDEESLSGPPGAARAHSCESAPLMPITVMWPSARNEAHLETRDYNGPGDWSLEAIRRRYVEHARALGQEQVAELVPAEHSDGTVRWIYPVMDQVIKGIERGDLACTELGVEFIESGHQQPFGRILHSNTARALRRGSLSAGQIDRLRRRILGMLVAGRVPHEFKQYAKLLRRIGLGRAWEESRAKVDESNPYVMRYVRYFEACLGADTSSKPSRHSRAGPGL